jgi:hypothetical protein
MKGGKVDMARLTPYQNPELAEQLTAMVKDSIIGSAIAWDWHEPSLRANPTDTTVFPSIWAQRARYVWRELDDSVTQNHLLRISLRADGSLVLIVEHKLPY